MSGLRLSQWVFLVGLVLLGVGSVATLVVALQGQSPWVSVGGAGVVALSIGLLLIAPKPGDAFEVAQQVVDAHDEDEPPPPAEARMRALARLVVRIGELADADDSGLRGVVDQSVDRIQELRQSRAAASENADPEQQWQIDRLVLGLRRLHAELVALHVDAGDADSVDEAVGALRRLATPFKGLFNPPI